MKFLRFFVELQKCIKSDDALCMDGSRHDISILKGSNEALLRRHKKPMQFLSRSWWGNISPLIIKQIHQFVSLMFHSCGRNIHHLKSRVLKPRLSPWGGHGCRSGTAELGLLAFAEGLGGAAAAFNSAHLWSQRFPFYGGRGVFSRFFFWDSPWQDLPPPKKNHLP